MTFVIDPNTLPSGITLSEALLLTEQAKAEKKRLKNIRGLRKYHQVHHDEVLEKQRAYREANRDQINARSREVYRQKKLEKKSIMDENPDGDFLRKKNIQEE